MPHRYRSWMWWCDKFASIPRTRRLRLLRWFTLLLGGPTFFALFLSLFRSNIHSGSQYDGSVITQLFGNDMAIVASPRQDGSILHFDLSQQTQSDPFGKITLCAHWCFFGDTYRIEMNERRLWGWLGSQCVCSRDGDAESSPSTPSKLVVFVGDNPSVVDAMRATVLSHHRSDMHTSSLSREEYKEIGHLSCAEVLNPPSRGLREEDLLGGHRGQGQGKKETVVLYMFSECARSQEKLEREMSVSKQMFSVYSDVERALALIRRLKSRAAEMASRPSSGQRTVDTEIVWYVPPSDISESKDFHARSRAKTAQQETADLETGILRQYLQQRHVLFGSGVFLLDEDRLLSAADPRSWDWNSAAGKHSRKAMALRSLGRAIEQKRRLSRGLHSPVPESISRPATRPALLRLCGALLNSRRYDDRCVPRPHALFPVLVTGLGGSGTHAVSDALSALGIDMPHERIGVHGSVCWQYAVNDALIGAKYPHHARLGGQRTGVTAVTEGRVLSPRFLEVVQVTRPAMAQISSLTSHLPASYAFIHRALLVMLELRDLLKAEQSGEGGALEGDVYYASVVDSISTARHKQTAKGGRNGGSLRLCPRGGTCHLHFAAVAWLLWNAHVASYLRPQTRQNTFRLDKGNTSSEGRDGILQLIYRACSLVAAAAPRKEDGPLSSACERLREKGAASFALTHPSSRSSHHSEHAEYDLDDLQAEDAPLADSVAKLDAAITKAG